MELRELNILNWEKLSAGRYTIFLAAVVVLLAAAMVLQPGTSLIGLNVLRIASTVVVLGAVLASNHRPRYIVPMIILVVAWLAATWSVSGMPGPIEDAILVAIFFYLVVLITAHLVRQHKISLDDISAAIAVYICTALAWAVSYRLIDTLLPGAFSVAFEGGLDAPIYFSLTTITTLGYGDITPVAPVARLWATLEAVVGLLYVAILISRLVSEFRR